ncbi:MAG TPA: hypothetical protein VG317_06485 [Pseudonocardiaceae bacterium]|nr:hypothetical protein [Pseudonocardiaceae bacterium]
MRRRWAPTALLPEWRTSSVERTVLAVVHNVTAATRLFDVLPLIATDRRVQVVFSCIGSSAFTDGTVEYLTSREVLVLPWKRALRLPADLAVAASLGGPLHKIRAPIIVLPHGMGYNKYLARKSEIGNRKSEIGSVFGLSAPWLMRRGRVIPAVLALSHTEQLDRLRVSCPPALRVARVLGDTCLDRMVASAPLRESYRQSLGVAASQRLIVVCSTWRAESLYGEDAELIGRLAASLPVDSHRIAVCPHPNTVHGHSRWQFRSWLDDCRRDGVLVLDNGEDWCAAVLAADLVVGDHGSTTAYAAAIGRPVLLAAAPAHTLDPDSPIARLLRTAPRLDPTDDPLAAVERAITEHDPARYADIATASYPGEGAARLRDTMYELLKLQPISPAPTVSVVPAPSVRFTPPRAVWATADLDAGPDELGAVVRRYAAGTTTALAPEDAHLVVDVDGPLTSLLNMADIVVHTHPENADRWIRETLGALPGALLATAREPGGWLIGVAGGPMLRLRTRSVDGPVFASVVHAWLTNGGSVDELPERLVLRAGDQSSSDSRSSTPTARLAKPRSR